METWINSRIFLFIFTITLSALSFIIHEWEWCDDAKILEHFPSSHCKKGNKLYTIMICLNENERLNILRIKTWAWSFMANNNHKIVYYFLYQTLMMTSVLLGTKKLHQTWPCSLENVNPVLLLELLVKYLPTATAFAIITLSIQLTPKQTKNLLRSSFFHIFFSLCNKTVLAWNIIRNYSGYFHKPIKTSVLTSREMHLVHILKAVLVIFRWNEIMCLMIM